VGHAVEHEPVQAIAGPGVVAAERLEDDERLPQFARQLGRPLEPEVPPVRRADVIQ
jgi:hypothetical protein